jgi:Ribonuclease G/E
MTAEIRIASGPGEARIAVLRDGVLTEYAIWRRGSPDGVGDVHRGRVIRPVPAMAGAFVAIAGGEGFLPDSEGAKGLTEGTILPVRVTRAAQGGKGPRLSAQGIEPIPPDGPVTLLRPGADPITRLAAAWPDAPMRTDDPALLARLRADFGDRIRLDRDVFDDAVLAEIDALADTDVMTPGGTRLAFHPTPALVAIDVDAGAGIAERGSASGRHRGINQAVIPELVRQIRLRNLSGAILVDFAGMAARKRAALGPALSAALALDPSRPRLLGFTALGLAEIVRPRVYPPLHEVLRQPLTDGLAALRRAAADPLLTVLYASPAVVIALERDRIGLIELSDRRGQGVLMKADHALADSAWHLERHDV